MPTTFPTSVDTWVPAQETIASKNPTDSVATQAVRLAQQLQNFNDAILALETAALAGTVSPRVVASPRFLAQTAAKTVVAAYPVGAVDRSFHVSSEVEVTAYTSGTFTVTTSYTDKTNTPRVCTQNFCNLSGVMATAIAAAGPFNGGVIHIGAKAGTTITVATVGTFTSLTYNVETVLMQVA